MALEPSGNSASENNAGEGSEVQETSPPLSARGGFAERSALFRPILDLPVELRALRGHIPPVFLRFAAARAEALNISADAVVRRSGVIQPDAMLEAYAADLGADIDPLTDTAIAEIDVEEVLSSGIVPANARRWETRSTFALTDFNIRNLYERVESDAASAKTFRVTSAERLRDFVLRSSTDKRAENAAFGLRNVKPEYSAGVGPFNLYIVSFFAVIGLAALSYYLSLKPIFFAIEALLALTFLTWAALRVYACFIPADAERGEQLTERDLPIYTILVPLHREAEVAADLVKAISELNYPREKLDVKLILETDDKETIAAVQAINLDPCFEIIYAPALGPRTKPKALRAALPLARGEFLVVYDAEDRPHPDQLRDAFQKFHVSGKKVACVQARLAIDNEHSNFLVSHFRAEYSGLFDVLLPALVRLKLPIPLGGTSNHFRIEALRKVGAWDPHNVTEDADLGIRLARFGYTTDVIGSTTYEEAPTQFHAWLTQRTRWLKGWLQTYIVHMRKPRVLLRQLGKRGFFAFQVLIGGAVLAALVHPIFFLWLLWDCLLCSLLWPEASVETAHRAVAFITLFGGYFASALLGFVGLRRRGQLASAWVLPLIPIYWLILSAAAWRAVWKLFSAPYHWEKTTHGVAQRNAAP